MPAMPVPAESANSPILNHVGMTRPAIPAIATATEVTESLAPAPTTTSPDTPAATSPVTPAATSASQVPELLSPSPQAPVAQKQVVRDTPATPPSVPSQPTETGNAKANADVAPAPAPAELPKAPLQANASPGPERVDLHRTEAPTAPTGREEARPVETQAPFHAQAPVATETPATKPIAPVAAASASAPALTVQAAPKPDTDELAVVDEDAVGVAEPVHASESAAVEKHSRVEEARPSAPLTDQVHERVSVHLDQLREMGHVEVQMNLHPPELGQVKMHLALDDGNLSVRFTVQNDGARTALTQQMEPMRVRFAEMGFSLGNFDVRRDNNSSSWQQAQDSEGAGQTGQVQRAAMRVAQKGYAAVTDSNALVDVIA
jgi:hypothetical protein